MSVYLVIHYKGSHYTVRLRKGDKTLMESNEKLVQLAERIDVIRTSIATEEATKTSMIMPFFQILGYDVFNPLEFVPEYTADVGTKKKEKVDYAIMVDNKPLIFVECKTCTENLDKHSAQLIRYFNSTVDARFAILTNGIIYKFFTDLDNSNIMDNTPFLTINLLDLRDRDIVELNRFRRDKLDVDSILSSAEQLKYTGIIKRWFDKEIAEPSAAFVKLIIADIYEGVKNQKVIDQFTPVVKKAINQYISDTVNSKIQNALNGDIPSTKEEPQEETDNKKEIITTIKEIEAYGIVKSILRQVVDSSRIAYRDTASYFGILLDDNNRKWICRIQLEGSKKHIVVSDANKNGVRYDIEKIDDIYNYSNEIVEACKKYI